MDTVDLFSGTWSFSKVAKAKGHSIFRVDNNTEFDTEVCCDILDLKTKDLHRSIDILRASPPCTSFSVASIWVSWCGNYHPKRVKTALGMAYVLKVLEIIEEVKPKYRFIENPRGVLRNMWFMYWLPRHTITYCQYWDDRMKPTDIRTNCKLRQPRPVCSNNDTCHEAAPRGSKTGTQWLSGNMDRSIIPPKLFTEIFDHIEEWIVRNSTEQILFSNI